jgi:hypothetical protein
MISIELLKQLCSTNSPSNRLQYVIESKELAAEEVLDLIRFFQEAVNEKKQQGMDAIKKRTYRKATNKNSRRTYDKWIYVNDYSAHGNCVTCGCVIGSSKAFRKMVTGSYMDCHALPTCFPDSDKAEMANNPKYIKDMEVKS